MKMISRTLCFLLSWIALSSHAHETKPNILLILADDVSPDMFSTFDQPGAAKTPNIDKLAARGVKFRTAYATAKCASSRVELMTGRYANATGVYVNEIWTGDAKNKVYSDHIAFSKVLHDAGYATAITGKWHAGNQMPYDDVLAFDEYALWEGPKAIAKLKGNPVFTGLMEDKSTTSRYWYPGYIKNHVLMPTKPTDYSLDIEADFIMAFMEKSVKAHKPFLAYWPTVAPHGTRTGMPTNPHRGEPGSLSAKGEAKGENQKETWARFKSLVEYLDFKVGQVVDKIDELGIADNTIIIFTSDNGTAVTAKTRGVERGSHVVHIAAGAGVKTRGSTDELTDFTDIAPTLIDLADAWQYVPKGTKFDGVSLKDFYSGKVDTHRPWIHGYAGTSQLFRTKNYMLEVVNPIMDMPQGRFYYTRNHRFGHGYERVDGKPEHQEARDQFTQYMQQLPAITEEHPHWQTKRGKRLLKTYDNPKVRAKHLHNHKDYRRYDETDNRPNVLFILLDDMGKEWVGAYGAEGIKTPNIDQLAHGGMMFNNVWSHPQCTPSRVSLITGQYPYKHGWVNHWDSPRWGQAYLDAEQNQSMATLLRDAGYATVAAGKWQVNDFRVEPDAMVKHGFDDYAMWTGYETGVPASAERYWDPYIHTKSGSKTYPGKFGEDVFSSFILDFVEQHKSQPWFAYYAMNLPHGPLTTTPHKPKVSKGMDKHKAMVEYADIILAKLVTSLEAMGERDNTIIVWTTDNGTSKNIVGTLNGRKVRGGKTKTTENGINSPFIVNGPGLVPQGIVTDALVDFTDLLPTLADLANTPVPADYDIDGQSFADLILGKSNDTNRKHILSMGGKNEAKVSEQGVENQFNYRDRVIRDKQYKLFINASPTLGYEKLVDVTQDHSESNDLLNSKDPKVVAAKQALISYAETLPQKDNDPKYHKAPALAWDTPATVKSQEWKK